LCLSANTDNENELIHPKKQKKGLGRDYDFSWNLYAHSVSAVFAFEEEISVWNFSLELHGCITVAAYH